MALSLYNLYDLEVGADCQTSAACAELSDKLSEIYEDPELLMVPIRGGLQQGMIKVAHTLQPAVQAGNPTPGFMSPAAMASSGGLSSGGAGANDSWGSDFVALFTALLGGTAVVLTIAAAGVFLARRGLLPFGQGRDYAYSRDFPKPNAYDDD
jgi:hypothetical protein